MQKGGKILNWVVGNLQNALNTWNTKLSEIWTLITQDPENFKGRCYMGSNKKHKWNDTGNRISIASSILFSRNYKKLW